MPLVNYRRWTLKLPHNAVDATFYGAGPLQPASSCARSERDPHKSPDGALTARGGLMVRSTTARCSAPRRGLTGQSNRCLIPSRRAWISDSRATRRCGVLLFLGQEAIKSVSQQSCRLFGVEQMRPALSDTRAAALSRHLMTVPFGG